MDNPLGIHDPQNAGRAPDGMRLMRRCEPRRDAKMIYDNTGDLPGWRQIFRGHWGAPENPVGNLTQTTLATDVPLVYGNKAIDNPSTEMKVPLSIPPPGFMSVSDYHEAILKKVPEEPPHLVENTGHLVENTGHYKIDAVLDERHKTYGKFVDNSAISQSLKRIVGQAIINREDPIPDDAAEALDYICGKIARLLAGDINHADSWRDIAGFSTLVCDRIEGNAR